MAELVAVARERMAVGNYPDAFQALTEARGMAGHERDPRVLSTWWEFGRYVPHTGVHSSWLVPDAHQALRVPDVGRPHRRRHVRGSACLAFTPDCRYVLSGSNVEHDARLRELDWDLGLPAKA